MYRPLLTSDAGLRVPIWLSLNREDARSLAVSAPPMLPTCASSITAPVSRGCEPLAQEAQRAGQADQRHEHVLTESDSAIGHVDPFAPVGLDEPVGVGDGEVLLVDAVVHVQRGRGRGLTESVRGEGG